MGIQSGYGFVHFPLTEEGINAASHAVEKIHNQTIQWVRYQCRFSHGLKKLLAALSLPPPIPNRSSYMSQNTPPPSMYSPRSDMVDNYSTWDMASMQREMNALRERERVSPSLPVVSSVAPLMTYPTATASSVYAPPHPHSTPIHLTTSDDVLLSSFF